MMSFGLPDTARYLNVGVMLINTRKWKENNYTEKGFTLINRYPERIFCVDQTVLNIILYNQVVFLPDKFNVPFYTREPVVDLRIHRDMVCHFVDSPKPWDFGGEFIHASFPAFKQFLKKTYFADYRTYTSFDIDKLKRMLFILIAYPRCFWNARKIKRSLDPNNHE
jgi:lipopolysaccharide biosynthesis glycosyltransferase